MRDITPRPIREDQRIRREAAEEICAFLIIMTTR